MKVKIKRLSKDVALPSYQTYGSVAFDLEVTHDSTIPAKELGMIPTGLAVCTPPGYMLMLASRSSTARKYGLTLANGVGIIDQDYCGANDELKLLVYNFTDKVVELKKGTRIAQGIFVRIDKAEWEETKDLAEKSRGGFGSTG